MKSVATRLEALEKMKFEQEPITPVPVFILPMEGEPGRESMQAAIVERENAGLTSVVFETVDQRCPKRARA